MTDSHNTSLQQADQVMLTSVSVTAFYPDKLTETNTALSPTRSDWWQALH
jgi:hypothetical protein